MFKKKTDNKLSRYVDPTGELPNIDLKIAKWYLEHKLLLQKIGRRALIAWCVITVGYSLVAWGHYLIVGYNQDQQMFARQVREFPNYKSIQPLYEPSDLQLQEVKVFFSASDRYDFAVLTTNLNERWVAFVTYKFVYSGGETSLQETALLPKIQRPIIYFGHESVSYPDSPRLVIENIEWRRVNPHNVANVGSFVAERMNFNFDNFKFTGASRSAGIPSNIIEFDLYNNSPYSYWEPEFYIELLQGNKTIGFVYLGLEKFRSGELQHIDVRSFVDNLEVSDILLYPILDVFAGGEYMEPGE